MKDLYKVAFENARDAIFWADASTGRIINCNKAAEKLLGRKRNEIIGMHQTDVHPPKMKEYYARMFRRHIRKRKVIDEEAEVITKSGEIRIVHISASVFLINKKKVIQGIFRDITEKKKIAKKLERALKTKEEIIEKSPFGIYIVNEKGIVEYVNPAMLRICGAPYKKFIGLNILKLSTYKKINLSKKIKEGLKGKSFKIGPIKYTSHLGRKTTIRNFIGIPIEENGKRKLIMIIEDITELKESEKRIKSALQTLKASNLSMLKTIEKLKKTKEFFERILNTIKLPIVVLDKNLDVKLCNKSFEETIGYCEIVGKSILKFAPNLRKFLKKIRRKLNFEAKLGKKSIKWRGRVFKENKEKYIVLIGE